MFVGALPDIIKMKNTNPKPQHILLLTDYLKANYEPTEKISESTLQLTTLEFYNKLQDLCPSGDYNTSDVFQLLYGLGYRFHENGDLSFHWLLKHK